MKRGKKVFVGWCSKLQLKSDFKWLKDFDGSWYFSPYITKRKRRGGPLKVKVTIEELLIKGR